MPKLRKYVSDEVLLSRRVHDLDPDIPLVASQVGILLARSRTRMDSDRRDGKPPASYKDRGKVLYRLVMFSPSEHAFKGCHRVHQH